MKIRTAILLSVVFFTSCASSDNKEEKVKKLIREKLSTSLNDFGSYEPVEYGQVDTAYTIAEDDPEYKAIESKYNEVLKGDYDENLFREKKISVSDTLLTLSDKMDSYIKNYNQEFYGWKVEHKYRAKNQMGGYKLTTSYFYFDPNLERVTEYSDKDKRRKL